MDAAVVNKVTEQVVRMLRQRGVRVTTSGGATVGQPTVQGTAANRSAGPPEPRTSKVFITAEMLTQRLATTGGGTVELAANEFLTPNAADLAEQKRLTIRRCSPEASPPAPASATGAVPAGNPVLVAPPAGQAARATIGIMTVRVDEKVAGVLRALGRDGIAMVDFTGGDCWLTDLRKLCEAVVAGQVPAGAAIVPYGADAMAIAGKTKGIRPVQGTRVESVAAALRHFDANLLVLEHAFSTHHQMRAMIGVLATGARGTGGDIVAAMSELEGK